MYKVTVNFAHGVSHTLTYDNRDDLFEFCDWIDTGVLEGKVSNYMTVGKDNANHSCLILNRDYICSVEIQEV